MRYSRTVPTEKRRRREINVQQTGVFLHTLKPRVVLWEWMNHGGRTFVNTRIYSYITRRLAAKSRFMGPYLPREIDSIFYCRITC